MFKLVIIPWLLFSGDAEQPRTGPWAAYAAMHRKPVVSSDPRWLATEVRILKISLENARRPEETYGADDSENTVYPR